MLYGFIVDHLLANEEKVVPGQSVSGCLEQDGNPSVREKQSSTKHAA